MPDLTIQARITQAIAIQVRMSTVAGELGITDHGQLDGLADDDHPQYLNVARGDDRYYTEAEVDDIISEVEGLGIWGQITGTLEDQTDLQDALDAKQYKTYVTVGTEDADYITDTDNDQVQIQDAIDAASAAGGGIVFIKEGEYVIDNIIVLKANVALIGSGLGSTIISITSGFGAGIVFRENSGSANGIEISGFTLDLDAKNDVGAIHIYQGDNNYLHDFKVINQGYTSSSKWTLRIGDYSSSVNKDSFNNRIERVRIENCNAGTFEQILFVNQHAGHVKDCYFKDNTNSNAYELIAYINNKDVIFSGNTFESPNAHSIAVMESTSIDIYSNNFRFDVSGFKAITVINSEKLNIHNNRGVQSAVTPSATFIDFFDRALGPDGFTQIIDNTNSVNVHHNYVDGWTYFASCQLAGTVLGTDYTMSQSEINFNNNVINRVTALPYLLGIDNTLNNLHDIYIENEHVIQWSSVNAGAIQLRGYSSAVGQMYNIFVKNCYINPSSGVGSNAAIRAISCTVGDIANNDFSGTWSGYGAVSLVSSAVALRQFNNIGYNPIGSHSQGNVTGATTFNRVNGDQIIATLTGNITITLTSGNVPGDTLTLMLAQDGTGSRTATWPSNAKFGKGGTLILSTTASAIDVITFRWDGTNWREISRSMSRMDTQQKTVVTVGLEDADYIISSYATPQLAFNTAIDYLESLGGGKLLVKRGVYEPTGIIFLKDNVWIQGSGVGITIFRPTVAIGNNACFYYTGSLASPLVDCTLSDFEIDGINMPTNSLQTGTKGINIYFSERLRANNLYIHDTPATGFGPDNNIDCIISNVLIEGCGRSDGNPGFNGFGVGCGGSAEENTTFVNCIAKNNYNNGFLLEYVAGGNNSRHFTFSNCIAEGNKRGFRVSGAGNVNITNCQSYDSEEEGMFFQIFGAGNPTADNCTVSSCQVHDNGGAGILFQTFEEENYNPIIIGNNVYRNGDEGIATGGNHAKIVSNLSWQNGKSGILYDGNSGTARQGVSVNDNTCYNNGQLGVPGESSGIRIRGTNASGISQVIVTNNICFDDQSPKTQIDGIAIKDYITDCLVADNDCLNNLTNAILLDIAGAGTGITVINNKGFNPLYSYIQGDITGATDIDRVNGHNIYATLIGNVTLTIEDGKIIGDELNLILTQDGTGSRLVTWPSNVRLGFGGTLLLSTDADSTDIVSFVWDGVDWKEKSRSLERVLSIAEGGTGADDASTALSNLGGASSTDLSTHISDDTNPHSVTKAQVGLSDVDNTSDVDKPISTLQQAGLDLKLNATLGSEMLDAWRKRPFLYSDFIVSSNGSATDPFTLTAIASGTGNAPNNANANHPGAIRFRSSTTTNSGILIGANTAQFLLGGGEIFEAIFRLETLALSTFRIGFHDTATNADATDGVYVEIDGSGVATGKTASNSSRSSTGTTTTLAASTWYRLRIVVNSTSLVTYTIYDEAGSVVWTDTLTTNIPSSAGRQTGCGTIATNSGTTALDLLELDSMAVTWSTDRVR